MTAPIRSMPVVTADFYAVRVHFDGLLQAHIDRSRFLGLTSWTDHAASYSIEFAMVGGRILVEYTARDRWESALVGLEEVL